MVDVDKCIRPQPFLKFFSGGYFAGTLQQDGENLKRLARQFQLYSSLAQFSYSKVNFESSNRINPGEGTALSTEFASSAASLALNNFEICTAASSCVPDLSH